MASRYELKKSDLKGVDFKLESLIQASTAIDCLIPLKETMRCVVAGRKAVHFRISLKYDTLTAEVYSWTEYESHHNIEATAIHQTIALNYFVVVGKSQPSKTSPEFTTVLYYPIIAASESTLVYPSGGLKLPLGTKVALATTDDLLLTSIGQYRIN